MEQGQAIPSLHEARPGEGDVDNRAEGDGSAQFGDSPRHGRLGEEGPEPLVGHKRRNRIHIILDKYNLKARYSRDFVCSVLNFGCCGRHVEGEVRLLRGFGFVVAISSSSQICPLGLLDAAGRLSNQ